MTDRATPLADADRMRSAAVRLEAEADRLTARAEVLRRDADAIEARARAAEAGE